MAPPTVETERDARIARIAAGDYPGVVLVEEGDEDAPHGITPELVDDDDER